MSTSTSTDSTIITLQVITAITAMATFAVSVVQAWEFVRKKLAAKKKKPTPHRPRTRFDEECKKKLEDLHGWHSETDHRGEKKWFITSQLKAKVSFIFKQVRQWGLPPLFQSSSAGNGTLAPLTTKDLEMGLLSDDSDDDDILLFPVSNTEPVIRFRHGHSKRPPSATATRYIRPGRGKGLGMWLQEQQQHDYHSSSESSSSESESEPDESSPSTNNSSASPVSSSSGAAFSSPSS
jgi:hypothetical protein